jgi:hypothetical protein
MPKTTAPLLSFGASGQIAKTVVYASWKGRAYARRHVVPSNPNTVDQQSTRTAFSFLQAVFKVAPALVTDVWTAFAKGLVQTNRNAWTQKNLPLIRGVSTLDDFIMSPGALGGLPATAAVVTPGSGTLSVAVAVPSVLPSGWTIYSAISAIMREQDPTTGVLYNIQAVEDVSSPYVCAFSGLGAHEWQVFTWLKWNRPDGSFAYSPSIQSQSTST